MELPELHVLERDAGARRHAESVAGVDEGVGGRVVDAPAPARGEEHRARVEDHHLARFHLERGHADHGALGIADEVKRHPLDEELRLRVDVALIQRVQHRVAGAVRGTRAPLHRLLAEVRRVPAEGALVDGAVLVAVEGHAHVLELDHELRGSAAHELDRVLVAEVVGALDGVVHVPEPVVFAHVAERGADAPLRRHGVRARREHLREHRHAQTLARELEGRAQPRAARAHDHRVELADGSGHHEIPQRIDAAQTR